MFKQIAIFRQNPEYDNNLDKILMFFSKNNIKTINAPSILG